MLPSVVHISCSVYANAHHADGLTLQPNMSLLTPSTSLQQNSNALAGLCGDACDSSNQLNAAAGFGHTGWSCS